MTSFGNVPASSVLPIFFNTFNSSGASVTITGLATSDIEIYKGTSMTQRSSDAGYTLLDTDGIDVDSITGIHGFSIDLGDNTDAGFYSAGSFYTVVVSAITADSQTVSFVAATFRIVGAENTAGTPVVDVGRISGDATAADNAEAFFDGTGYAGTNNVIPTVTTLTNLPAITANWLTATGIANDAITAAKIADGAIDSTTFAASAITSGAFASGAIHATAIDTGAIRADVFAAGAVDAAALATDAVAKIADGVWDEATSGHATAGTTGAALTAAGSAGDPWSTSLPGAYGAGTAGKILGDNLNATVSSRSSHSAADVWAVGTRVLTAGTNLVLPSNALSNVTAWTVDITGSLSGAVGSVTGNIGGSLTSTERNAIADALLNRDMSAVSDTNSRSPLNALRFVRNKWSVSGTTLSVMRENDSDVAWTATVSTDAGGLPIVGNDPA